MGQGCASAPRALVGYRTLARPGRGGLSSSRGVLPAAAQHGPALLCARAAPNAPVSGVLGVGGVLQGVGQALATDLTPRAYLLGQPGAATLLREEHVTVDLGAERTILPRRVIVIGAPEEVGAGPREEGDAHDR